jgi:hypothetical protein
MSLARMMLPPVVASGIMEYSARWENAGPPEIVFPKTPRLLSPHPIYRYMGERMNGTAQIEAAKAAGWRCFLRATKGRLIALDVFQARAGFDFRLHSGKAAEGWMEAIRATRRMPRFARGGEYSMRTLLAPVAHLSCLWFSGVESRRDYLAVLETDANSGRTHHSMTAADWEALVGGATLRAATLWPVAEEKARRLRASR